MEVSEGEYESYHRSAEFDEVKDWFEKILAGSADFSTWKKIENDPLRKEYDEEDEYSEEDDTGWEEGSIYKGETEDNPEDIDDTAEPVAGFDKQGSLSNTKEVAAGKSEPDTQQTEERIKSYWYQLQREQKGQVRGWYQLLVIFGESWHDEHNFFSTRDVELAIEGIHEGKYTKVFMNWGTQALDFFPGVQNDLMVIWCTNNTGKGNTRFLAKEGTVTQVKFWLVNYLNSGVFEEMNGWTDITGQIEKANRKGKKKHG